MEQSGGFEPPPILIAPIGRVRYRSSILLSYDCIVVSTKTLMTASFLTSNHSSHLSQNVSTPALIKISSGTGPSQVARQHGHLTTISHLSISTSILRFTHLPPCGRFLIRMSLHTCCIIATSCHCRVFHGVHLHRIPNRPQRWPLS